MSWRGPPQQFNPQEDRRNGPPIVQIGSINEARAMLSYPDDYPQTAAEAESRLDKVAASSGRLWLVRFLDTITDPAAVVPAWADRSMLEVDHQWFAGPSSLQAYAYATRRPPAYRLPEGVNSLDAKFNNGASLVGYELKPVDPKPGETALLTLYWRCDRPITQDYQVAVRLRDVAGSDLAQHDATPLSGLRPTVVWQRGEIIRDDHPVKIPETLRRPGLYRLAVGMYMPGRKISLVPLEGGGSADLALVADMVEHPAPVQVAAPERVLASFGSSIVLQGYRLVPSPVTPADSLGVALLWKAVAPPAESYKVFVHLLDASGNIVAQQDDEPLRGAFPTSKWATGDVVEDKHTISLSPAAPAGAYSLAVGLYSVSTGRRLEVSGTSDARVILGPVDLRGGV